MSAYLCERELFVYLVDSCLKISAGYGSPNFRWYHKGSESPDHELHVSDPDEKKAEVCNMLLRENIRSLRSRYGNTADELIGEEGEITEEEYRELQHKYFFKSPDMVQIIKACDCLEYQSCESSDWERTQASAFVDTLRRRACHKLPGYDDASWGAP